MTDPIVPTPEGEVVVPPPTQVEHPWKATLRTFIQALLALTAVWTSIDLILTDYLNEVGWDWAIPYLLIASSVAAAISRIMAIPVVNGWLTKLGLGATPKPPA